MSHHQPYLAMAQNNAWANHTLFQAMAVLSKEAFTANRPGFFPSLCATLNHIHAVDLYYIDALVTGKSGRAVFARTPINDPNTMAKAQNSTDMRLTGICRNLTPQILAETRSVDRHAGPTQENIAALLLHLFKHQIHLRGQAHVQLQSAGIAPPQLDEFHLQFDRAPSAGKFDK